MEPYLLTCIESRVENSRNIYGQFRVGPFLPEDAVTIANSLRRSLLSEIYGFAITHVIMEGRMHEYSTVAGVRESVLDILLNVKQIVLTSNFNLQEPQIGFLQVQGPGIVRAGDIKLPLSVQVVDPEQYIATLLYDGLLKIKFLICRGKNYIMPPRRGVKIFSTPARRPKIKLPPELVFKSLKTNLKKNRSKTKKTASFSEMTGRTGKGFVKEMLADFETSRSPNIAFVTSPKAIKDVIPPISSDKLVNDYISKEKGRYIESQAQMLYLEKQNQKEKVAYGLAFFNKPEEKNKILPVSVFPIDAVFMPINKVNFAIETNDLSETPKDRVILEIWTNGSIHPKQAIHEAAKALIQLISPLQEPKLFKNFLMVPPKLIKKKRKKKFVKRKIEETERVRKQTIPGSVDIGNLNLSVRPHTCLKRAKIETVADLLQYSSKDLLNLQNFGKGSLTEVENVLNQMGFKLRS